jgi:hypothetical protein
VLKHALPIVTTMQSKDIGSDLVAKSGKLCTLLERERIMCGSGEANKHH